jgi:hypothetical protein
MGSIKVIYISNSVKFLLFGLFLLFTGCQSTPSNPEAEAEKQINACLPNAIIMAQALRRQDVWAKVLVVKWNIQQKINGHAYTVYLYPAGQNQLWAYDRDWGSIRVRALREDVWDVALKANKSRNITAPLKSAEYID